MITKLAEYYRAMGGSPNVLRATLDAVGADRDSTRGFIAALAAAGQAIEPDILAGYETDVIGAKAEQKTIEIGAAKAAVIEADETELAGAVDSLARLLRQGEHSGIELSADHPESVLKRIKNTPPAYATKFKLSGKDNDFLTFPAGGLSFIVAPSGHGKTTMLLDILADASKNEPKRRNYLFSFEEDAAMVYLKTFNAWANMYWGRYRSGNMGLFEHYIKTGNTDMFKTDTDFGIGRHLEDFGRKWGEFWGLVENGVITIKQGDFSADALCRGIHELSQNGNAGVVLIDYAQLLYTENGGFSRPEELKQIMLALKDTAVETGLPIVMAAQFNRQVVHASLMHMSKIADAADIERAASKIVGLWNGNKAARTNDNGERAIEGFNESAGIRAQDYFGDEPQDNGTMFLRVLKDRNGISERWATYPLSGGRLNIERVPERHGYGEIFPPAKEKKEAIKKETIL